MKLALPIGTALALALAAPGLTAQAGHGADHRCPQQAGAREQTRDSALGQDGHAGHAAHQGREGRTAGRAGLPASSDQRYAGVQERGRVAMGVDQYRSTHRFDALADGGRIEFLAGADDAAEIAQIRRHLREIAGAFARGDFTTPAFIHDGDVPGTEVMAARRSAIRYEVRDLPRGAELRMTSRDPEVLAAIRAFMAFQRSDHRAGGADHPGSDAGRQSGHRAGC